MTVSVMRMHAVYSMRSHRDLSVNVDLSSLCMRARVIQTVNQASRGTAIDVYPSVSMDRSIKLDIATDEKVKRNSILESCSQICIQCN